MSDGEQVPESGGPAEAGTEEPKMIALMDVLGFRGALKRLGHAGLKEKYDKLVAVPNRDHGNLLALR